MGRVMKEKQIIKLKEIMDIIIIFFIPVFCTWIKNNYENYTAKQISIFIGSIFLLINGCLFLKNEKKNVFLKKITAGFVLGISIIYSFDQQLAMLYIGNFLCTAFIIFLIKKGWEIRKDRKRWIAKLFLCFGILCFVYNGNYYYLFQKSIQDYSSMYEMDAVTSPKGKYTAISYMYDLNENEKYIVFVKMIEKKSGKEKNIYLAAQNNLNVTMKWASEERIAINGSILDVKKDIVDKRK